MARTKRSGDEEILKVILKVIIQKGATSFSLEDFRNETGLSPSTLLQRFGSKKNILYKAIELANNELKVDLNKTDILITGSIENQIIGIYRRFTEGVREPLDVANGLDILKLDITDEKLNQLTREYFAIRRERISSIISSAQLKNEISNEIDAEDLAWNLESLWQGTVMLWAMIGQGTLNEWLTNRFQSFLKTYVKQVHSEP